MKKWILIILILLMTGCDYKELSEISIGTMLGIDKKDGQYTVSSLIVSKEENETILYTGKGSSITTALNNLSLNLSQDLYLGHIQVIILSDELAKEGLSSTLDYFIKNDTIKGNFNLFLSHKTTAEDILKTLLENNHGDYNSITNLFKYNDKIQFSNHSDTVTEFLDTLLMKGKQPTLNTIALENGKVIASELGIFKGDKLSSFSQNMIGISILSHKANHVILNIPCEKSSSVIEIDRLKVQSSYKKKGIQNKITGNILMMENGCKFDMKKDQKEIIDKTKKELSNIVNDTIRENKKNGTDVFGYGNLIYQKKGKIEKDYFSSLAVHNQIDLHLEQETKKEMFHE